MELETRQGQTAVTSPEHHARSVSAVAGTVQEVQIHSLQSESANGRMQGCSSAWEGCRKSLCRVERRCCHKSERHMNLPSRLPGKPLERGNLKVTLAAYSSAACVSPVGPTTIWEVIAPTKISYMMTPKENTSAYTHSNAASGKCNN